MAEQTLTKVDFDRVDNDMIGNDRIDNDGGAGIDPPGWVYMLDK